MSEVESRIDNIQEELEELKRIVSESPSVRVEEEPPRVNQTKQRYSGDLYIAIGAVVISVIVMVAFGLMLYVTATAEFPSSQKENVSGLLWTLNTLAVSVVSYWVGSSSGSARKTYLMETMNNKRRGRFEK